MTKENDSWKVQMDKEILIAARALIEKPENWTQGYIARGSKSQHVDYLAREAVCFCAIGAIYKSAIKAKFAYLNAIRVKQKFAEYISANTKYCCIPDFNDSSSHQEVLAMFDRYIETLP